MNYEYKFPGIKCKCDKVQILPIAIPKCWIEYFYPWELCQKCGRNTNDGDKVIASVVTSLTSRLTFTITEFIPDWK